MTTDHQDQVNGSPQTRLRIVVFACHRSVPETEGAAQWPEGATDFEWRIVRLACSGKVEVAHVLRALEEGADGVCVVGCPEEECAFLAGSRRARKRVERAQAILEEIGLGGNRATMIHVFPSRETGAFEAQVLAAARGLEEVGPSPLRK